MEPKPEKKKQPKVGLMISGERALEIALANQRVLDEIWRKHKDGEKK